MSVFVIVGSGVGVSGVTSGVPVVSVVSVTDSATLSVFATPRSNDGESVSEVVVDNALTVVVVVAVLGMTYGPTDGMPKGNVDLGSLRTGMISPVSSVLKVICGSPR